MDFFNTPAKIAALVAFITSFAVELLARVLLPESIILKDVYQVLLPYIHIVGYGALALLLLLYFTQYRKLVEKIQRENKFRDRAHGPLERVLDEGRKSILLARENDMAHEPDVIRAQSELDRALSQICFALEHLVPEYKGSITAYVKDVSQARAEMQVVRISANVDEIPPVKEDPHPNEDSPSLQKMVDERTPFAHWSKTEDETSSVQKSAACGVAGGVLRLPGDFDSDIIGMLCINFTDEITADLMVHQDLLSRWLPAIANRIYYSHLHWKNEEAKRP